jgi:hypothetical protein
MCLSKPTNGAKAIPFESFTGSKGQAGTFQRIIGQMPPHTIYVEPFAGSAVIFRAKRPALVSILIEINPAVSARLGVPDQNPTTSITVVNGDAISWLGPSGWRLNGHSLLPLTKQVLVYVDPPYLLATRQQRLHYADEPEVHDPKWHTRLLALLQSLDCHVMLSGYPSELYSSQLRGWRCLSYRTRTRGKTLTECLWCNFPEPTELHDWRYAGKNFRQRTSFKRLAARWLERLDKMPPLQRGYVLNAIAQRESWRCPRSTSDSARGAVATNAAAAVT